MQFIEDHEATPRRWYGGAVGAIGFDGGMNTGLTLRTAHIRDGIAAVRAGATLLFDSDPAAEERETQIKARALMETLKDAERAAAGPVTGTGAASAETGRPTAAPGPGSASCSWTTRTRSCTPWPITSASRGRRSPPCRAGFPPALLDSYAADLVVLSPGPGRPADFACDDLLTELDARGLPAFGVCLGLQAMIEHAGGELSCWRSPRRQAGRGPGPGRRPAERAAGGVHRCAVPLHLRAARAGQGRIRGDRDDPGRRGDGHRGRRGRALGASSSTRSRS